MFNCTRIHAIGYYDEQAAEAVQMQAGRGDGPAKPLGYYDNEVDLPGLFYKIRHAISSKRSPFDAIRTGDIADSDIITRLAAGQDPRTGKQLVGVSGDKTGIGRSSRRRKVVGYDLQISAPKSVSVLYALGSPHLRSAIQSAHGRAFLRVLRYIEREGLIITRTGARSHRHESASETVASLYTHILSRDLDPQLHTHGVLLNLCVRPDGKIGAIDNHRLKQYGGAIAALYRCELAAILRAELGLEAVRDKRNFKLPIVPDAITRLFSKRRIAIEAAAEAAGFDTASDRKRAQKLSNATRAAKKQGLSLSELTGDWVRQAREAGFDPVSALAELETLLARDQRNQPAAPFPSVDTQALLNRVFSNQALHTWPQILRVIAEELQVSASAAAALAAAESVRSALVAVDRTMEGDAIYTSEGLIRAEHDLLRMAQAGRGSWHGVAPRLVETVLARETFLSAEQRDAIAHALNDDAMVAIEGPPGTGKSIMTAALHDVAKAAGVALRVTSVSWQATHVVRRDAGVSPDRASALTPLLNALDTGKQILSAQDIVIVDEAGMAGLVQIAALARHCHDAGAKLILLGDTRQLQPVSAGAPMRALTQLLGHGALHTIRRQETEWMRQASMDLAAGRSSRAIDSYDNAGAIALHPAREATLSAAADDYLAPLLATPEHPNEAMRRQLLVTSLNDDVAELNGIVRAGLQQAGRIGADDIVVPAFRRGTRDGDPVDLPLARDDRIIFGERVELGDITLYNADIARVMWIEQGSHGPIVTFVLDRLSIDGQPISFVRPWKDLVSAQRRGSVPIAQHAYATTVHAAQGATVDRTVVAMTTAMSAEPLFVAMTRHRKALTLHVDAGCGQRNGRSASIALSRSGRLRGTDEAVELDQDQSGDSDQHPREAALTALKRQAMTTTAIDNPSRYIHDVKAWIADDDALGGFRRQLAVDKELAAFKSRFQSRVAFPAPVVLRERDPLALSPLELKELDRVPLTPARISRHLGLIGSPNGLHRPDDRSEHLRIRHGEPLWSKAQLRRLVAAKAPDEHIIVQIAVVMLRKSVQAARAVVRAAFRLAGLNPLAEAAARRKGLQVSRARMPFAQMDSQVSALLERVQARRAEEDHDMDDDRQRNGLWLRLAAQWRRSQASLAQGRDRQDTDKQALVENRSQSIIAAGDLDRGAVAAEARLGIPADKPDRAKPKIADAAFDELLAQARLQQQRQEEEEAEEEERQDRRLAISKAVSVRAESRQTPAPLTETSREPVTVEPVSAGKPAAPAEGPVAPPSPPRPRVSSKKEIAARVTSSMREYGLDPFALPAHPAPGFVSEGAAAQRPSPVSTDGRNSDATARPPRHDHAPSNTTPPEAHSHPSSAANTPFRKTHPGQAQSAAVPPRSGRGRDHKGRE